MRIFWFRIASVVLTALMVVACGGDPENPSSPGVGSDPGAIQIRGGERLTWVQSTSTGNAIWLHQFTLFIDGTAAPLADASCGASASSGFECSARLPPMSTGRHVLELMSTVNGLQSPRSSPLTVMMGTGQQASDAGQVIALPGTVPAKAVACADGSDSDCYKVSTIAEGLRDVSALTTDADDRLLFIEERRSVRLVEAGALLPEPAYIVERSTDAIVGLASDPATMRRRTVFVAWTEPGGGGQSTLSLSRYREVGGSFGEGATIVTGMPLPDGAAAPLRVDDEGLLYVALPKADGAAGLRSGGLLDGYVLRFASDGSVPAANPRASPVFAAGLARPTELAFDPQNRRMWVADAEPQSLRHIASFALQPGSDAGWPYALEQADLTASPFNMPQFATLGRIVSAARRSDGGIYLAAIPTGSQTVSILLLSR